MSKINVSVDCVIFGFDDQEKQLKVLLIQKKINPYDKKNNEKQIAPLVKYNYNTLIKLHKKIL